MHKIKQSKWGGLTFMPDSRLCVGIVIVNDDYDIFVAKRYFKNKVVDEYWQMPQGGIDPGETPQQAMLRELYEETGIKEEDVSLIAESKNLYTYEIPTEYQKRDFSSQTQHWFLVRFKGSDDIINVNRKNREFSEWEWAPYKLISKLVIPFKKEVYKQVMKDFEWYFAPIL